MILLCHAMMKVMTACLLRLKMLVRIKMMLAVCCRLRLSDSQVVAMQLTLTVQ
jgi:hypothetical protein